MVTALVISVTAVTVPDIGTAVALNWVSVNASVCTPLDITTAPVLQAVIFPSILVVSVLTASISVSIVPKAVLVASMSVSIVPKAVLVASMSDSISVRLDSISSCLASVAAPHGRADEREST